MTEPTVEPTVAPTALGPVVVGTGGGTSGADALALARWCGQILDVPLVVAVVHPAPAAIGTARVDAEWVADRHRVAQSILDDARATLGDTAARYRIVSSSSAAHGLHDLAEETGAALIVVGSRGRAPERRLFAGSTATRLLSGSVCPVAVAPAGMRDRPMPPPTRIGVGYIDTPEAKAALDLAARVAARAGTELRLYSVAGAETEIELLGMGHDGEHAFSAAAHEAFRTAQELALAGLPPEVHASGAVLTGHAAEVLAELDEPEIDALFVGSRGYGPVRRVLLGGVSSKLVHSARSPLVVVPRAG